MISIRQIRERASDRKIKRELLAVVVFGFIAACCIFTLGVVVVLWMVEKGWIN